MTTPAPWKRLGTMIVGNLHRGERGVQGDVVCRMRGHIEYKNERANARLISTAPDLLSACREVKEWIEENPTDKRMPGWGRILDLMEVVVAKVEGRTS
jgi:hypothetical protein